METLCELWMDFALLTGWMQNPKFKFKSFSLFLRRTNVLSFVADAKQVSVTAGWGKRRSGMTLGVKEFPERTANSVFHRRSQQRPVPLRALVTQPRRRAQCMADRNVRRRARGGTEQSHRATITGFLKPLSDKSVKRGRCYRRNSMWDRLCPECTDRDKPEVEWKEAECAVLTHRMLSQPSWLY